MELQSENAINMKEKKYLKVYIFHFFFLLKIKYENKCSENFKTIFFIIL